MTCDILAVHAFSVIYFVHSLFVTLSLQGVVLAPILSFHTPLSLVSSLYVFCCPTPSSVASTWHPQSAIGVQSFVIAHHVIDSVHTSDRHALTSYAASRLPTPPVRPPTVLHRPLPGSIFRSGRTRPVRYHPKACCERCVGHHPFVSFHFTPLFGVVEAYSITQVLLDLSP